jgi:hypothetical protein
MIDVYIGASITNQLQSLRLALEYLSTKADIIIVELKKPTGIGLLDFDALGSTEQRQQYIDMGYRAAKAALDGLPH